MPPTKDDNAAWVAEQRLKEANEAYFWAKLRKIGGYIAGVATSLWAVGDAAHKLYDYLGKK